MKEMGRQGREAFRAIYLASPLKFCTTLHAFARVTPQYHISAWEKDPWAWQRHKYHRSRSRVRGRFCYIGGPMGGVKSAGWPEPSLLGTRGLVEAASRAQAERLEDYEFWQQVAERAIKLRDVMDVGSLAVILDALLTANHRHTHLMKTLSRELVDDVDKLSLVEAAVVLNAYAHFSCVSAPLLTSLSQHVARLLTSQPYTTVDREHKYGVGVADPQTLAVLCKAFASLKHKDSAMLQAINGALVERIEDASFASTSDVLTAFADLGEPFEAPSSFWASLAAKVPGSQMRYLCPALRSFSKLDVSNADLYQAVGTEILSGLQMAPAGPEQIAPAREAQLLGRRGRFPAFAPALPLPSAMLAVPGPGPSPAESSAVHIRRSDKACEAHINFQLSDSSLGKRISAQCAAWHLDGVFLCSDDASLKQRLKHDLRAAGLAVSVYPSTLPTDASKAVHFDKSLDSYRKAEDVMMEAMIMARGCHGLLSTYSNVSASVVYLSPDGFPYATFWDPIEAAAETAF